MKNRTLSTFSGWMAAAGVLLAGKPDGSAIMDGSAGYIVVHEGSLFALPVSSSLTYSVDDLVQPDASAWNSENGCWDGSTPEQCQRDIFVPRFVTLTLVS